MNNNKIVLTARAENGLYVINERASGPTEAPLASNNKTELWHRRLGHLNFASLYRMASKNIVNGLD